MEMKFLLGWGVLVRWCNHFISINLNMVGLDAVSYRSPFTIFFVGRLFVTLIHVCGYGFGNHRCRQKKFHGKTRDLDEICLHGVWKSETARPFEVTFLEFRSANEGDG